MKNCGDTMRKGRTAALIYRQLMNQEEENKHLSVCEEWKKYTVHLGEGVKMCERVKVKRNKSKEEMAVECQGEGAAEVRSIDEPQIVQRRYF